MRKRLWDLAKSRIEIGTILPGHRHKVVVRLEHQSRTSDAKRRPLLHHGNQKRAIKADVGGVELLDEGLEEEVLRRAGRVHHLCARTKHWLVSTSARSATLQHVA